MGIIQRQSFKGSITNLLGVLLGFVATIYVYPLDFEAKGFVDFLVACTTLFIPFANLGLQSVFLKYYPIFQSHNKIENFKGFLFFRFFIQYAIFAAILILFEPFISNFLEITKIDQRGEFSRYYLFILILLGIELGNGYLIALSQANRRIVIPQILHNTSQKVVFPALILLRLWLDLSFDHLAYLLIAYYAFILISLTIYNYRLGVLKTKISFTLPINNIKSEVRNFSRYNSLTAISGQFTVNIDRILVAMFVGFSQSGIYSIAAFISNVIAIPLNPMTKISIPILTKEILADNWSEVNDLYKKSSNVLLTVGMALFLFLYFGFDFIVNLTEHSSQLGPGKQVLFLLGLGILFNLATSINSQIIAYSKYYRYSLYFLLILGVNNVVLNIILIGKYGMIGAAWSTMISLLLFNILKVVLLYRVQKLSPFNKNSIKLFLLFAVNYGILALLHWQIELENGLWSFFVNLTVLSVMLLVCYAVPAYFWKTSKEINEMIDDLRERLNSTLKKELKVMVENWLEKLIHKYKESRKVEDIVEWLNAPLIQSAQFKGQIGAQLGFIFSGIYKLHGGKHFFVFNDKEEAAYFYNDLQNLMPEAPVMFLPGSFKKPFDFGNVQKQAILERTEIANRMTFEDGESKIIVTYPEAIYEKLISPKILEERKINISVNEKLDLDFLNEVLLEYGFKRVDFVYEPGEFAIRGGIVDIFSYGNDWPYRIELFDEDVESIRVFDPVTQLSRKKITSLNIIPDVRNKVEGQHFGDIFDLLSNDSVCWVKNMSVVRDILKKGEELKEKFAGRLKIEEFEPEIYHFFEKNLSVEVESLLEKFSDFKTIYFGSGNSSYETTFSWDALPQPSFNKNFPLLIKDLRERESEGYSTFLFTDNERQVKRLSSIFQDLEANVKFQPVLKALSQGFIDKETKVAIYTDHQIFLRFHRYKLKKGFDKASALNLKFLKELVPGDFVTHIDHGVGKYSGLEKIELNGKVQESVRIIYQNNDILYVSINSLHKISKYVGKDGTPPKLNKLGSDVWQSLKRKTKKQVKDIAGELIKLYAKRKASEGFACTPDDYLQNELESSFFYEDTPDQVTATQDVKEDMQKAYPMDRLICGDVGFGKTEIAIRGAFKAVVNGKQVAVLVPTTILALQHYKTFKSRLDEFNINVDYINRFRSSKEKSEIYQKLANGEVDVLIGTHAILNKKVKFKDLGLLVIDEEQKFGVTAKEKIRGMKVNVDTLTLTATPIPRTLQFSLMAARDMSILRTAPPNRQPIYTEIKVFDHDLIKEAIYYEIERGGQVFFVHNRVKSLAEMEVVLKKLCPDIDITSAHGQLEPKELEKRLVNFIDGKYDVLLATNIIETGLDIPNANTIIINNAHMFGLSDLHQLRGRVGRSNKKAFCYLFCPPLSTLTSEARKRLKTIEEFSDLGSGFQIAMKDLDIRGAGNLLGSEQSGFISEIGYETYQKILEEAILELKETDYKELFQEENEKRVDFTREVVIESDEEMYIPDSYINVIQERMNIYKELDDLKNEVELKAYREELEDRFGPIPKEVEHLFQGLKLRWIGMKLGFERIDFKKNTLRCYFIRDQNSYFYNSMFFKNLMQLLAQKSGEYKINLKQSKTLFYMVRPGIKSFGNAVSFLENIYNAVSQPVESQV